MKKIAVIGAGISGLSVARQFKKSCKVKVFEKESQAGGLIRCRNVDGNLYHVVGGHVFNSKRQDVLDWFWQFFDKDKEFTKAIRNAVAYINKPIGYPVENHIYQFDNAIAGSVVSDLLQIQKNGETLSDNFEDFLKNRFGATLYNIYFKPYNEKVWKRDLREVPLLWLEGKLPMPNVHEILLSNIQRQGESEMVHSSFYYPSNGGSQFIADRLSQGLDVVYNHSVENIRYTDSCWYVDDEEFDIVIYTGNLKCLPALLDNDGCIEAYAAEIGELASHGTTTALCEIDANAYSWIYLPDDSYQPHRIICTGNFSQSNNARPAALTATVEFTDYADKATIDTALARMPFSPRYLAHHYTEYTYPIQGKHTRELVSKVKSKLAEKNFYLSGRFAEWEYYNMDAAIGASIDLADNVLNKAFE